MKITVDAGHGPDTPGKRTPKFPDGSFMHEYEFNAATARYMIGRLTPYADVEMLTTFEDGRDVPLRERTDRANAWKADVFVSIHANAHGSGGWDAAHGIETYAYVTKPGEAVKLAGVVQRHLLMETGLMDRGVQFADFHVLRETRMTAILCECGFMTNEAEANRLRSDGYRQSCAKAIAEGLVEFYGLKLAQTGPFPDVEGTRWSAPAIAAVKNAGILSGYPDGTFRPEQPVTREELAAALAALKEVKGK